VVIRQYVVPAPAPAPAAVVIGEDRDD
jgi:hypothetical protein